MTLKDIASDERIEEIKRYVSASFASGGTAAIVSLYKKYPTQRQRRDIHIVCALCEELMCIGS